MSLIKCPECGSEISDRAQFCPKCGCPSSEWKNIDKETPKDKNNDILTDEYLEQVYEDSNGKRIYMVSNINRETGVSLVAARDAVERWWQKKFPYQNSFTRQDPQEALNEVISKYSIDDRTSMIKEFFERTKFDIKDGTKIIDYAIQQKQIEAHIPEDLKKYQHTFNGVYRYTLFGEKQEVYCPRCHSSNCSHYKEQKIIPGKVKTRYTINLNPLHPFTLVNKKDKIVRKEKLTTENKFICNECGKVFY